MYIAKIVEELGPMIVRVALQQLVDFCVLASGEFTFQKSELVLCSRNFGARVSVLDPKDPTVDVLLVERR